MMFSMKSGRGRMHAVYGARGTMPRCRRCALSVRADVSEMQTKRVDIRFFPDASPQT
ncbi:hypothetical protein B7R78_0000600 [Ralstonia solanacearum]|uniref:hypothetical protein n=1 Tax=Ralstonia solanacearum TaxID=305 RepID=UPI0013C3F161|nr:hypothetical protein [Ralstonia solanacearum]MBT1535690.1 hypothetical protein [Ralstonia solanacearum]MDB0564847.1 hypothetical protein [Ralstonia solanacearum]